MLTIYIRHLDATSPVLKTPKYYRARVTTSWAKRHDNGALISCGLTVGDRFPLGALKTLIARGQAVEVDQDTYNHSGCQSACILRGHAACRW